jgi:Ser/Thr protein kinase RdoA (MazF antagonist)
MAKDFFFQPTAPDPVLDAATVLSLTRQHVPSAQTCMAVDENGGEARTYAIDDDLILKVQRPNRVRPRTSLKKERFFLDQLLNVDGVRVPRVIGGGLYEPSIEYTLMTRMPGIAIEFADLVGEARQKALFELGRMVRRIHAVPQQPLFDSRLIPGDHTPTDVQWRFGNLFDEVVDTLTTTSAVWTLRVSPANIANIAMRALPDVDSCLALHSNPGPEHVFVDAHSLSLSGIIDFGDAYFSHPVHDLRRFRCPADRASIYAGYTADMSVSDNFVQTWRVACTLSSLLAVVHNPACRAAALDELTVLARQMV